MPGPNSITPAQLLRLIGTAECPAIIDVSIEADFDDDPHLIPTALRHPHRDLPGLVACLGDRRAVVVCQKGRKLSQGVAAYLRTEGIAAEYLDGGNHGWRDLAGAPRIPAAHIPLAVNGASLWVTRQRPKIDRIACPWLIRRFIDPRARFLFVEGAEVLNVADRLRATAFDVPGAPYHHEGSNCSFDALLDGFNLTTPALDTMARIIRAADTGRPGDAPQAAGLLALSVSLSRQYRDDNAQLTAALPLYDALYRWARDGQSETHSHEAA